MSEKIFLNDACTGLPTEIANLPSFNAEQDLKYVQHDGRLWSKHAAVAKQIAGWERFVLAFVAMISKIQSLFGCYTATAEADWQAAWDGRRVYVIYTPKNTAQPTFQQTPQVIPKENGEVVVIKPAKPLRNLVLQGGGAKGIVYATYLKTLHAEAPFREHLKNVAGTSAGAMMACLIAAGADFEEVENFLENANMLTELQGEACGLTVGFGLLAAGNLCNTLRQLSIKPAKEYFQNSLSAAEWDSCKARLIAEFGEEAILRFEAHKDSTFVAGLTFEDLTILQAIAPSQFKALHITGFNARKSEAVYFNAQNHPQLLCHEAVRISMAIPYVVQPVTYAGESLSDGGERSNISTEVFDMPEDSQDSPAEKAAKKAQFHQETLALVFANKGKTFKRLHASPVQAPALIAVEGSQELPLYQRIHNHTVSKALDRVKVHALGPNVGVIPHPGIGTLSFNATRAQIDAAKAAARCAAIEFAEMRQGQATYATHSNMQAALDALA